MSRTLILVKPDAFERAPVITLTTNLMLVIFYLICAVRRENHFTAIVVRGYLVQ